MDKIKGVFFDLGGTLRIVEKVPEHQERAKVRMARLAGREDVEAFINMVEARYEPYREWALGENREAGDYELWHQWLLPELGEERLRAVCHEMTYQYRQVKGLRHVVEGGLQVIRGLYERGYRLGIISNLIGEDEIPNWLREDGLAQYFDAVVLSSVCHIRKPAFEIYQLAAKEMGVELSDCVSVADNVKRDIPGAKKAGVGANIIFSSPEKKHPVEFTEENRPDAVVEDFREILNLLPPLV